MKRSARATLVVLLSMAVGLLPAVPVAAQTRPPVEQVREQPVRQPVDPLAPGRPPGWLITPGIGVAELWDDNVSLAAEGPVARDYLTSVKPSLNIGFRGRRANFSTGYHGRYDFYRELAHFDEAAHYGSLGFDRHVSRRVKLFASDTFSYAPTTEDLDLADVPLRRRTTRVNDFRSGFDATLGRTTTVTAAYLSQWVTFAGGEEFTPFLRGGLSHGGTASLRRALSPRLTIGARYDFARYDLQHPLEATGGNQVDAQDAGGLVEYQVTPSFGVGAEAGYAWLTTEGATDRQTAPTFGATLGWHRPRVSWDMAYSRSLQPSFGVGGTSDNHHAFMAIRAALARWLHWSIAGSFRKSDSLGFDTDPILPPVDPEVPPIVSTTGSIDPVTGRIDPLAPTLTQPLPEFGPLSDRERSLEAVSVQSRLTFVTTRWLRLEIFATHWFQDSNVGGGKVRRTQAGVQVTTGRPFRVR
jgi:hypothetical protein